VILPINDDILEYIQYFIREEQMKNNAGADNAEVIAGLKKMVADYSNEIDLFKKTLQNQDPKRGSFIQLPAIAASSRIMLQLKMILSAT
jgi:hypothetical protein